MSKCECGVIACDHAPHTLSFSRVAGGILWGGSSPRAAGASFPVCQCLASSGVSTPEPCFLVVGS